MKTISGIRSKVKYDTGIETNWNKNDIIRHKVTGHPYLVVHVYQHVSTIIIDLLDKSSLRITYTIVPSEYDNYTKDKNMEQTIKKNVINWEYKPQQPFL
jgi:hypothetical protein